MSRASVVVLLSLTLAVSCNLAAQSAPTATHAPSGGTRETVVSIYVPPLTKAPFSATVATEWTRTLEDGSTLTLYNQRLVTRDSAGRIFQERRTLVPKNGEQQPEVWRLEFSDPVAHQKYFCELPQRTCTLRSYYAPTEITDQPAGPLGNGRGDLTRESLGTSLVDGLEATGTRETVVLKTGAVGNDRPLSITREFWYSARLGINLVEKRMDPRHGTQSFSANNIVLAEPDAKYFAVPAGFTVVKHTAKNETP